MKGPLHILRRVWLRLSEHRRRARFARSLRRVSGHDSFDLGPEDVLAIVLVKNGAYYLDQFLSYYRQIGIRHFAFIDNGSTDDTLARLAEEPGVIVDQSDLALAQYEDLLRAHPAQTYGRNRWCLYVDMDEVFDFEGRSDHGIHALTSYMTARGHTALVAQMLEMFPKEPLSAVAEMPFADALEAFRYFDISTVTRQDYHDPAIPFSALLRGNQTATPAIQFYFGGVRGKVFGERCCLTKHPLIFNGPGVTPAPHPHLSMGVTCTDFSAVIKHYKFAGDAAARDRASQRTGALAHGEDAARAAVMARGDVTLFSLDARRWNRVELLVRAGFLVGSADYHAHLESLRG